ncbi:MAG TPA: winged helix-turn-helix domain-containing protein [Mycobacteriales bacterium]|nr:winged helix-turn-helix domain-containing protein [Mycobacteriales bacterium]
MKGERRAATEEEARAMASAVRLRILRLCLDQPLTNKQIAEALGRDPASVLYHVRRLVQTGFLVPENPRRGTRGAREVPYRSTGKSWHVQVVDPVQERANAAVAVEAFIEDARRVGPENVSGARLGLRLTADEHRELTDRLEEILDDFAARKSGGEPWSLFVGLHPDDRPIGKPDAGDHSP